MTLALYLWPLSLGASTEINVTSPHKGQEIYVVAVESAQGHSDLSPGIYALHRGREKPQLIIEGKVLGASRSFNGVFGQFSLTRYTDRNEAIAVVDGRLVLFGRSSGPRSPDSILVFGDKKTPVMDVTNQRAVQLAPLMNVEDVSVHIGDLGDSSFQMFVVSLRQPNQFGGTGVTFAGLLARDDEGRKSALKLVGPPVVIDYEFYEEKDLAKFTGADDETGDLIFSPLHASVLSQPRAEDNAVLEDWRSDLSKVLKEFKSKKKSPEEIATKNGVNPGFIPHFSLLQNRVVFASMPSKAIFEASEFEIRQNISPTGHAGSYVRVLENGEDEEESQGPRIQGSVDFDSEKGDFKVYPVSAIEPYVEIEGLESEGTGDEDSTEEQADESEGGEVELEGSESAVLSVDGQLHAVFKHSGGAMGILNLGTSIPQEGQFKVSAQHAVLARPTGGFQHFIFISRDHKSESQTSVYVVDDRDGILRLERQIPLSNKFLEPKELAARIHVVPSHLSDPVVNPEGQARVLFDPRTSAEKVIRERRRKVVTTPLINVMDVKKSAAPVPSSYLKALESYTLSEGRLFYRKFNLEGAKEIRTGFYLYSKSSPEDSSRKIKGPRFLPGELLKRPDQKSETGEPFCLAQLHVSSSVGSKKSYSTQAVRDHMVSVYAYNPTPGGEPENKVGFLIHAHGGGLSGMMRSVELPFNFKQIDGVKIIQGRRSQWKNISVLVFMKEDSKNNHRQKAGGVVSLNFRLEPGVEGISDLILTEQGVNIIQKGEVNPTSLKHRMLADTAGDLYWIATADRDHHDRNFGVVRMVSSEEKTLYPNRPGERIPLRFNENLANEESESGYFGRSSRWLIYSQSDLQDAFSWFKKLHQEREKDSEEKIEKQKRVRGNLFPQLDSFLELRAGPSDEKLHEVILVEPSYKASFLEYMISKLAYEESSGWSLRNSNFEFFVMDDRAPYSETRDEIDKISSRGSARKILFADLADLLRADQVDVAALAEKRKQLLASLRAGSGSADENESEDSDEEPSGGSPENTVPGEGSRDERGSEENEDEEEHPEDEDVAAFPSSHMMVLASEGDKVPLRSFRGRSRGPNALAMMIVATPDEWEALQDNFGSEAEAGVFDSFHLNSQFLSSTWTMWPPVLPSKASKEVLELSRVPVSKDEYQIFGNLEQTLNRLASLGESADHRILVVPEELKPLVKRMILSRWATSSKKITGPWNHSNSGLALFQVNLEGLSQELVGDNFNAMRGAIEGGRRPVLLGDMADVLKVGRPRSTLTDPFLIKDPVASKKSGEGLLDSASESGSVLQRSLPHLMWYLASEGREIQPKRHQGWKISSEVEHKIPMLIVASEKDLNQLSLDTSFESRFLNLTDEFKTERLEVPSTEIKIRLIEELFNRPEVASLEYQFDHNGLSNEEARKQIVALMVGRVEQIARMQKQEPTTAFLKTYTELRRVLTEDTKLRQDRRIDRFFFERLYRRVFPMPLSFDILDKDDPLNRLKDPYRAAIGLQEKGYEGSIDLKKQVVEGITAQTKGAADAGRKIPSSMIIYGDTSTGKTFLFETIIKYLGLTPYNYDQPNEVAASYFVMKPDSLVEEDDPQNPSKLSVKKALMHLEHFLSLPNGYRGFILIDDLHKATPKVRTEILAFLQKMLEAPQGMLKVRRHFREGEGEEYFEIPVRNLNLFLTLNPQSNRKKLEEYVDKWGDDDLDKYIIASLAGGGVQVDESFVARWSVKINLNNFPRDAKLPTLVARLRASLQQEYSSNPRLVLVTPEVLDLIAAQFERANAREFLTSATISLMGLDSEMVRAPIYIIKPNPDGAQGDRSEGTGPRKKESFDSTVIQETLRKITIVQPVRTNDVTSKVALTSFILDGFRNHVYNSLIGFSQQNQRYNQNPDFRRSVLPAILLAAVHNMSEEPTVPMKEVRMSPLDFEIQKPSELIEYNEAVKKYSGSWDFFRFQFSAESGGNEVSLSDFLSGTPKVPEERGRMDVMRETSGRLEAVLSPLMAAYFRTENVHSLPSMESWTEGLSEQEPKEAFKRASDLILEEFFRFSEAIYSSDLREMASDFSGEEVTFYDRVRLFLMCVDKAMMQLPWGAWSNFILKVMDRSTTDLGYGLSPELQHLIFSSTYSPLTTITIDAALQSAEGSREYREYKESKGHLQERFDNVCEGLLDLSGGSK